MGRVEGIDFTGRFKIYGDAPDLLGLQRKKDCPFATAPNCLVNHMLLDSYQESGIATILDNLRFTDNLEDFQIRDVAKMVSRKSVLNRNPMGYGKTVEAIRAARELNLDNILVVCPKSVRLQWKDQFERWWPDSAKRVSIDGNTPIVITNYEKLLRDNKYNHRLWSLIIADEAHRIKNRSSKRAVALKALNRQRAWAMTGTPVLNKPDDIWSILNFLDPYISGKSYWDFVYYFCKIEEGFFGQKIVGVTDSPTRVATLHKLLDIVSVYNSLQLTKGKQLCNIPVEMTAPQKKLYNFTKNIVLEELPEEMTIPNGAVLCTRLLQVTSNPSKWGCDDVGTKFEYIKDLLEDNPEEKIVVFSMFSETCRDLASYLIKSNIQCSLYTGKIDDTERYENKLKFMSDTSCRAIIGTIGAMGEGVDGLQSVSHTVVFMERGWSPEILKQCEDRLNRTGQKHKVIVHFLECAGSFDSYVQRLNMQKATEIRRALNT